MSRKYIILLCVVIIVLIGILTFSFKNNDTSLGDDIYEVNIIKYELGTNNVLKKIKVTSSEDIDELTNYVKRLKRLAPEEMVNLALAREIEIKYGDYITIGIQLSEKEYCYYTNHEKNISDLSKMPDGLYEWVEEKLE